MIDEEMELYNKFFEIEKKKFKVSNEDELIEKRKEWIHKEIAKMDLSKLAQTLKKQDEDFYKNWY